MKTLISTIYFTLFLSLFCSAQEKVNFKLSPKQGKLLKFEMTNNTDFIGTEDVTMSIRLDMTFNPIQVVDTAIIFDINYSNLKMDMNAGMMMISYDSNQEPKDEMSKTLSKTLSPLLNNTLNLVMNRKGKISSIDFPNVSDQAFDKSNMQNIATSFPDQAISFGDTWTDTKTIGQLGVTMEITNTLEEKTKDGYKISTAGILTNSNGEEIGSTSGYMLIDKKTHFTKSALINSTMEILGQKIILSTEIKQVN